MRDLRGVNAEEADVELGLVAGDGGDCVPVADALHGGNEGAGAGGVGNPEEKNRDDGYRRRPETSSCEEWWT